MKFTPLPEASSVYISLPEFVPSEQIGINMQRIGRLAHLGGFQPDVTVTSFSGDTSSYAAQVVGIDSRGTASAGAITKKQANAADPHYPKESHSHFDFTNHDCPPLTLRINTEEINNRLGEKRSNLRDPKAWAGQLNRTIGEGLREAAWKHYVREAKIGELVLPLSALALDPAFGDSITQDLQGPVFYTFIFFMRSILSMPEVKLPDTCWSIMPVAHIDRALAVSVGSRAFRLVKALPAHSQKGGEA